MLFDKIKLYLMTPAGHLLTALLYCVVPAIQLAENER